MKSKSPEMYLSKKDILIYFKKATESDIDYLIKNKLLKPMIKNGTVMFSLSNILDATFQLAQFSKNIPRNKSISLRPKSNS